MRPRPAAVTPTSDLPCKLIFYQKRIDEVRQVLDKLLDNLTSLLCRNYFKLI